MATEAAKTARGAREVAHEPRSVRRWQTLQSGFLSLLDQGFVSGARFATSILLGRFAGQEELGAYSMGFGLLVLVVCIQESLIAAPYVVLRPRRLKANQLETYNGNALLHCLMLSAISVVAFGLCALIWRDASTLSTVFVALAISSPPAVLREFARRTEFARLNHHIACWIDGCVAVLQVVGLFTLGWRGQLNSSVAFLLIGAASAITSVTWLYVLRGQFRPNTLRFRGDSHDAWMLGKWAFLAQTTGLLHLQGMSWLVNAWLGLEQTGLFAACSTLVLFINPFALGLNNFVAPLAVRTAHESGVQAVKRLIGRAMAFMCLSVFFFCSLIYFTSDHLMLLLFKDESYLGHKSLIMILGINITLNAVHMVNDGGIWALERPRVIFIASVVAVAVTFSLSTILIPAYGLHGAAWSLLIGRIVAATLEAGIFFFGMRDVVLAGDGQSVNS